MNVISPDFGTASASTPKLDQSKKTLLFIDDRPNTLSANLFNRNDFNIVLIRYAKHGMSESYIKKTESFTSYYRDASKDLKTQISDFVDWCKSRNIKPDFLLNPSEPEQVFAHALGREIGVPSLSEEQVTWLRNKVSMKDKFREIGIPTAEYKAVSCVQDVIDFAKNWGWPVVVKPQEGFACIKTYKIQNDEEAEKLCLESDVKWMVESYAEGIEWECCALIAGGKVLDTYLSYMPARPIEIVDGAINANITVRPHPADFPVDTNNLVQRIVDGMRLDHGYMHMEFFVDSNGQFLMGETGLRLAGCEIPANHAYACGFNLFDALIDIHMGKTPSLSYGQEHCAGDLLLPAVKGTVSYMTPAEELLTMPGVISYKPRISIGDFVEPRRASHFCSAVVHVEGQSVEEVLDRMNFVLDHYKIYAQPESDAPEPFGPK